MAALVETMMYVREKPWHGLGVMVEEAPTSKDAIKLGGIDWLVEQKPVFDQNGKQILGYYVNTRDSDGAHLGVVGSRYSIVQNWEAFEFTDALTGEGLKYETVISLKGGRCVVLLGRMPTVEIAGDKLEPYVCFMNTHDGSGAVKVCMTPVRVVCNNTLNFALSTAKRKWSCVHKGNIQGKLSEARQTLGLMDLYLKNLAETADMLACAPFYEAEVMAALKKMLPVTEKTTERQKKTIQETKEGIIECTFAPDLVEFLDTKWGFLNAVADYVAHSDPMRKTESWQENRFAAIVAGHPLLDKAFEAVGVAA